MSERKEYKLEDLTIDGKGSYGIAASAIEFDASKYTYLRITDINDDGTINKNGLKSVDDVNASNYLLRPNDIVFARTGASVGRSYFYDGKDGEFVYAGFLIKFSIDPNKVNPKILKYYTHSQPYYDWILSVDNGATRGNINAQTYSSMPIILPDRNRQDKIVSILSSLDDKIDLLHRENKTLEAMAETLFRKWFVEDAKEDWEEGKLGDYVNETIGGEWGKENSEGDFTKVVQCIRGTDIADLNIGLANKAPIRFVKESKFEKIEPRNGDIIMEISGGTENQSTGRVVCINEDVKTFFQYPIVFSNFCRLLRVDEKYSYFLYCYLKYLYDQDEYFNLENGSSGIKNLDYKALLYDLTYPMPKDKRIIFKFNDNVSLYFKRINKNKKQIQTLTQTRNGLLPKLMSGEIKV